MGRVSFRRRSSRCPYYPDSGVDDTLGGPLARRRCCSLGQRPLQPALFELPPSHPLPRRDKLARQGGHLSSLPPWRQPKFSANSCRLSQCSGSDFHTHGDPKLQRTPGAPEHSQHSSQFGEGHDGADALGRVGCWNFPPGGYHFLTGLVMANRSGEVQP